MLILFLAFVLTMVVEKGCRSSHSLCRRCDVNRLFPGSFGTATFAPTVQSRPAGGLAKNNFGSTRRFARNAESAKTVCPAGNYSKRQVLDYQKSLPLRDCMTNANQAIRYL